MAVPPADLLEVTLKGHVVLSNGKPKNLFNVFHYTRQGIPAIGPNLTNAANSFTAVIGAPILAAFNPLWLPDSVTIRDMTDDRNQPIAGSVPGAATGTSGDRLPTDDAVFIQLANNRRGRGKQGGKHFTPVSAADVTKDELNVTGLANWSAVAAVMIQSISDTVNGWQPCTLFKSTLAYAAHVLQSYDYALVLGAYLDKDIGTMRRRKEGTAR